MEIKQLEYFRAIVDEGTISGAARALHMTQPQLSDENAGRRTAGTPVCTGEQTYPADRGGKSTVCAGGKSSYHDRYYEKRSDQS